MEATPVGNPPNNVTLDRLLKLRLVVARHGEMDLAGWWNTQGVLGRRGAAVYRRGFPTTHLFAQARVVFEVARSRCREIFAPPNCVTLWSLPADVEDQFEEHWQDWLDDADGWKPVFAKVEAQTDDLIQSLADLDLLSAEQVSQVKKLRRSAENKAVLVPGQKGMDDLLALLAGAFALGVAAKPAVPYARLVG